MALDTIISGDIDLSNLPAFLQKAMAVNPRITSREGYLPCAFRQFGCVGNFDPRRAVVQHPDGNGGIVLEALCANVVRHTEIARANKAAGAVLGFYIQSYQVWNSERPTGSGVSLDDFPVKPAEYDADGRLLDAPHTLTVAEKEAAEAAPATA